MDVVGYDSDHVFYRYDGAGNFIAVSGADSPFDALTSSTPADDTTDGVLAASSDAPSHFSPGLHLVTWSAQDGAGNSASAVQSVRVNPQVSFAMDQATTEDSSATIRMILNGPAASYPVSVPYVVAGSAAIDGSDHDLLDGPVRISVNLIDANSGDSHSFDWTGSDPRLSDIDSAADSYTFSPAGLAPGLYRVRLVVSDGSATDSAELSLDLMPTAPNLSMVLDSDSDGSSDAVEGIADGDNDGVHDYLDAITQSNVLQAQSALSSSHLIESEPGSRLLLGPLALLKQDGMASVALEDIESFFGAGADTGYDYIGGLFDFAIEEIPIAGQSVSVRSTGGGGSSGIAFLLALFILLLGQLNLARRRQTP